MKKKTIHPARRPANRAAHRWFDGDPNDNDREDYTPVEVFKAGFKAGRRYEQQQAKRRADV